MSKPPEELLTINEVENIIRMALDSVPGENRQKIELWYQGRKKNIIQRTDSSEKIDDLKEAIFFKQGSLNQRLNGHCLAEIQR